MRLLLAIGFFLPLVYAGSAVPSRAQGSPYGRFEPQTKLEKKVSAKLRVNDLDGALKVLGDAIAAKQDLFEAYLERSRLLSLYRQDVDGALADVSKAIELKPGVEEAYRLRAMLRQDKRDLGGAIADYDTALTYSPRSIELMALKSRMELALRNYSAAIATLDKAIEIAPSSLLLHTMKAGALATRISPAVAAKYLSEFLSEYERKREGKLPKVRGERVLKKKAPAGFGGVPVRRYSQMSFDVASRQQMDKIIRDLEEARELASLLLELGRLYLKANEIEKSLAALTRTLEIDPNHEQAYGLRGAIYLSRGEILRAIEEFDEAIEIADVAYFYLNRGIAYFQLNNEARAQKDFDMFLKIQPDGKAVLDSRIREAKALRAAAPK